MKIQKYNPVIFLALSVNIILLGRFVLTFHLNKEILILEYGVCLILTVTLLSIYFMRKYGKQKATIFTDQMIASEMKIFWPNLITSVLGFASSTVQIYSSLIYYDSVPLLRELGLKLQDHVIADTMFTILLHSYLLVLWMMNLFRLFFNQRELQRKKQLINKKAEEKA